MEDVHWKISDENNGKKCLYCKRIVKHLYRHVLSQHKNKKYDWKCDTCKKSFQRRDTLLEHKKTHSDLRPYICETCNSAFKTSRLLRRHEKTHLQKTNKQIKCPHCHITFTRKDNLTRHVQKFHKE